MFGTVNRASRFDISEQQFRQRKPMTHTGRYRDRAMMLRAMAGSEPNSSFTAEWERLALAYFRLAEHVERNNGKHLTCIPNPSLGDGKPA